MLASKLVSRWMMSISHISLVAAALAVLLCAPGAASPGTIRASPAGGSYTVDVHADYVTVIAASGTVRGVMSSAPGAITVGFNKKHPDWVVLRPQPSTRGRASLLIKTDTTIDSVILNVVRSPDDAVTWFSIPEMRRNQGKPGVSGATIYAPRWSFGETLVPQQEGTR